MNQLLKLNGSFDAEREVTRAAGTFILTHNSLHHDSRESWRLKELLSVLFRRSHIFCELPIPLGVETTA